MFTRQGVHRQTLACNFFFFFFFREPNLWGLSNVFIFKKTEETIKCHSLACRSAVVCKCSRGLCIDLPGCSEVTLHPGCAFRASGSEIQPSTKEGKFYSIITNTEIEIEKYHLQR